MPFDKVINIKNTQIGIWNIEESIEKLEEEYNPKSHEQAQYSTFTSINRKKEWLSTRLLLRKMFSSNTGIKYTPSHKPVLINLKGYISITHSKNKVAIFYNDNEIGADMEHLDRKIAGIVHRVMNTKEIQYALKFKENANNYFLYNWCAKEALYKCIDIQGIDFTKNIRVLPTTIKNSGQGSILLIFPYHSHEYIVNYMIEKETIYTWVTR